MLGIVCQEREILRGRFRADLKVYIDSATRLENAGREEFESTHENAERARLAFLRSRAALDVHIAEHRCETLEMLISRAAL